MKKTILSLLLLLTFLISFVPEWSSSSAEEEPLMRIVMFSDLHVEFGLQDLKTPIRPSTLKAVNYVLDDLTDGNGVDVVMVGGDMTGPRGSWNQSVVTKTKNSVNQVLSSMTKDNKVLYVMGNHDPEPSLGIGENRTTDYSGDYSSFMNQSCGEPVSVLHSDDILSGLSPYNEVLCYRYTINGIEFIGMNTPYTPKKNGVYSELSGLYVDQVEWVEEELAKIGKDKTVFLFSHYPIDSLRTLLTPTALDAENMAKKEMERILKEYPSTVYCFGHTHSGETRWAKKKTSELVQLQQMSLAGQGLYSTKSYIDCHMGSMGYYDNPYQPGGLTAEDPMVVQFVMVELYADRMVFQVHNTGEKAAVNGSYEISPLAVSRDLRAQFGLPTATEEPDTTQTTDGNSQSTVPSEIPQEESSALPIVLGAGLCGVVVIGVVVLLLVLRKKPKDKGAA